MFPSNFRYSQKQSGSSLIIAIFILVVMLLLGVALSRMLSTSSETIVYEVTGARAFQAANVGAQQKLAEIFPFSPEQAKYCDGTTDISEADPTATIISHSDYIDFGASVNGLRNCKVAQLECDDFKVNDVVYYRIKSTGQCDVGSESVSRTVEVEARSL